MNAMCLKKKKLTNKSFIRRITALRIEVYAIRGTPTIRYKRPIVGKPIPTRSPKMSPFAKKITAATLPIMISACGGSGGGSGGGGGGGTPDTTPPSVVITSPANNSTNVNKDAVVTATFNESLLNTSVSNSSFTLSNNAGAVSGNASYDNITKTATFTPSDDLLLLTEYTAELSTAIADEAGNFLASNYQWTFIAADGAWDSSERISANTVGSGDTPQIAVNSNGEGMVVWSQNDGAGFNIWADRYTSGSWATPQLLETNNAGNAEFPMVAMDSNGNAMAVWQQFDGSRLNIIANYYTAGVGWGTAAAIETDNSGDAERPEIDVDSNGNFIAAWSQHDGSVYNVWANRYVNGVGWGTAELIESTNTGDAIVPRIAIDSNGDAVAAWYQTTDGVLYSIYSNRYESGVGWGTAELIENSNTGTAVEPKVAIDGNNNAFVVWYQSDGTRFNIWTNRFSAGSWGTPQLLETDDTGHAQMPQIAADSNGNALAVWKQTDGTRDNVWANYYTAGAGWGSAQLIETDNTDTVLHTRVAMDENGNGIATWYMHDGSEYRIWSNRFTEDSGWETAALADSSHIGDSGKTELAFDSNGRALATWIQLDGVYYSIYGMEFK